MKRGLFITIIFSFSILLVACNNDIQLIDEKKVFEDNINDVMNIIKNNDYDKNAFSSNYNIYYINNNVLYGHNYNYKTKLMEYNLFEKLNNNITSALFAESLSGDLYATVQNDKYCAVKDFSSNEIEIYSIDDEQKCHKLYVDGEDLVLEIIGNEIEKNKNYNFGDTSKQIISLTVISNIIDSNAVGYTWYRNNEKIDVSNIQTYTITADVEDANYYVEIITPNGDIYKSEPVNVKIDRR